MATEMLQLLRKLRTEYFPKHLQIGYCIDVCKAIATGLERDYNKRSVLVRGSINGCLHVWLEIDGIQYDVSRDCIGLPDVDSFVELVTSDYLGFEFEPFDYWDYST